MRKHSYKNYENRKDYACNIKINDYNVSYVINAVAKDKNISKADLIKELMYDNYASYFHEIPENIQSIIDNMKQNLQYIEDVYSHNAIEYYISRLEKLKGENNANN